MTNIFDELGIRQLQHIGIPVTGIRISESFYKRLGFTNVMEASFLNEGKTGTCIMMERPGMLIELYQLPDHQLASVRARKDGHIDHIAFDVADIDKAFTVIKQAGFSIMEEQPVFLQFWKKGCKYFNITGPDGERLEFNQVL